MIIFPTLLSCFFRNSTVRLIDGVVHFSGDVDLGDRQAEILAAFLSSDTVRIRFSSEDRNAFLEFFNQSNKILLFPRFPENVDRDFAAPSHWSYEVDEEHLELILTT